MSASNERQKVMSLNSRLVASITFSSIQKMYVKPKLDFDGDVLSGSSSEFVLYKAYKAPKYPPLIIVDEQGMMSQKRTSYSLMFYDDEELLKNSLPEKVWEKIEEIIAEHGALPPGADKWHIFYKPIPRLASIDVLNTVDWPTVINELTNFGGQKMDERLRTIRLCHLIKGITQPTNAHSIICLVGQCLPGNELVYTPRGVVKASEVYEGMEILGGYVRGIRKFKAPVYKIRVGDMLEFRCSEEHPIWIRKAPTKPLRASSHSISLHPLLLKGSITRPEYDSLTPDLLLDVVGDEMVRGTSYPVKGGNKWQYGGWVTAKALYDHYSSHTHRWSAKLSPSHDYDIKTISVGREFAKLLGYLMSDGAFSEKQSAKFTNVTPAFLTDVAELALKVGQKFNFSVNYYTKGRGYDMLLTGKHGVNVSPLKDELRRLGVINRDTFGQLQLLETGELKELIKGYFNGDGSLDVGKGGRRRDPNSRVRVTFGVGIYERQADELQFMLWRLGIKSTKRYDKKDTCWLVRVAQAKSLQILLGFLEDTKYPGKFNNAKEVIVNLLNSEIHLRGVRDLDDGSDWMQITSIQKEDEQEVIGWETAPSHKIICSQGLVTHNTGKSSFYEKSGVVDEKVSPKSMIGYADAQNGPQPGSVDGVVHTYAIDQFESQEAYQIFRYLQSVMESPTGTGRVNNAAQPFNIVTLATFIILANPGYGDSTKNFGMLIQHLVKEPSFGRRFGIILYDKEAVRLDKREGERNLTAWADLFEFFRAVEDYATPEIEKIFKNEDVWAWLNAKRYEWITHAKGIIKTIEEMSQEGKKIFEEDDFAGLAAFLTEFIDNSISHTKGGALKAAIAMNLNKIAIGEVDIPELLTQAEDILSQLLDINEASMRRIAENFKEEKVLGIRSYFDGRPAYLKDIVLAIEKFRSDIKNSEMKPEERPTMILISKIDYKPKSAAYLSDVMHLARRGSPERNNTKLKEYFGFEIKRENNEFYALIHTYEPSVVASDLVAMSAMSLAESAKSATVVPKDQGQLSFDTPSEEPVLPVASPSPAPQPAPPAPVSVPVPTPPPAPEVAPPPTKTPVETASTLTVPTIQTPPEEVKKEPAPVGISAVYAIGVKSAYVCSSCAVMYAIKTETSYHGMDCEKCKKPSADDKIWKVDLDSGGKS
jgi:LAGLIDADG-like domain